MLKRAFPAVVSAGVLLGAGFAVGQNAATDNPTTVLEIEYGFSHSKNLDRALAQEIDKANETLDIAIYSITKGNIVQSILNAHKRGVKVRIISDFESAQNKYVGQTLQYLKSQGIPIKLDKHPGYMHLKMTVIDRKVALTGSYNYTNNATYNNDEMLVLIRDQHIATEWANEFDKMWNDPLRFMDMR